MKTADRRKKRLINLMTFPILYRPWRKSIRKQLECVFIQHTMKFADIFGCTYQKFVDNPQAETILVIDMKIPAYDRDTGSRVIWQYLNFFRKQGLNVYYMPMSPFPKGKYLQSLNDIQVNVVYQDKEMWLKQNGSKVNYVLLCRPDVANKMLEPLKKYISVPIWYFDHDLHYIRERRDFEQTGNTQALARSKIYEKIENEVISKTDVFLTVSDYEKNIIAQTHPHKPSEILPIYIWNDFPKVTYKAEKRKDIMFVGSSHAPNVDAIQWFLSEVFPKFNEIYPEVKFYIVGGIPENIKQTASSDVIFTGFISDEEMNELMSKVRLNVVPLRFGAGVKGKIIESIYQKLPVLTTPVGAEGIADTSMMTVCTLEDFAQSLIELYANTDRLTAAAQSADEFLQNNYSEKVMQKVFNKLKEKSEKNSFV